MDWSGGDAEFGHEEDICEGEKQGALFTRRAMLPSPSSPHPSIRLLHVVSLLSPPLLPFSMNTLPIPPFRRAFGHRLLLTRTHAHIYHIFLTPNLRQKRCRVAHQ